MSKAAYVAAHGEPSRSGGSLDPHVASLMGKLQKLQMSNGNAVGEFIICEPDGKDENLKTLRSRVYCALRAHVRRQRPAAFKVRMLTRRDEGHFLIWKEPLPVPVETNAPAVTPPAAGADAGHRTSRHRAAA
jgi:hypothetical protein